MLLRIESIIAIMSDLPTMRKGENVLDKNGKSRYKRRARFFSCTCGIGAYFPAKVQYYL